LNNLLIKNGLLIHADKQINEDILIRGETIQELGQNLTVSPDTTIIDASGKLIFPGVIDPHTHMGIPIKDGSSADTFATGSRSALHGGVTTILDFTVLGPGQTLCESLETRQKLAAESLCDVGLHINITRFEPEILDEIPLLIKKGYNSFKVFTTYEEAGMMLSYGQIEAVAKIIGENDGILMVHSEDNETIMAASEPFSDRSETHPKYHAYARPAEAEAVAIQTLGEISTRTNCTIYIVHLNTAQGLAVAAEFPLLKVETCPHYLMLTEDVYEQDDGTMFVASPPLRKQNDQDALWQGIQNGQIHTIGSDHCPFCLADKTADIPFQDIPNGMGGVETLFPGLLAQFIKRNIDLSLLTQLSSRNAAKIFDLDAIKGSLSVGAHADLLIIDPKASMQDWELNLDTILDWNAYAGLPAIFPETVIRRGEIVVASGQTQSCSQGELVVSTPS
jgi:dihydropyrimidinase